MRVPARQGALDQLGLHRESRRGEGERDRAGRGAIVHVAVLAELDQVRGDFAAAKVRTHKDTGPFGRHAQGRHSRRGSLLEETGETFFFLLEPRLTEVTSS